MIISNCKLPVVDLVILTHDCLVQEFGHMSSNSKDYVKSNPKSKVGRQIQWIMSAISTVRHLHNMQSCDGRYRSSKYAPNRRLVYQDNRFGCCALFSLEFNLTAVEDEHGLTIKGAIFHRGDLIYPISAWENFVFELYPHLRYERPPIIELPDPTPLLS